MPHCFNCVRTEFELRKRRKDYRFISFNSDRQYIIGYDKIPNASKTQILCSTEFFVLRSINNRSIAFLVPFLLSNKIQKVLVVSQEGGHHPRFIESTLLTLPIPRKLVSQREMISQKVIEGIASYRFSESTIADMVNQSNKAFEC